MSIIILLVGFAFARESLFKASPPTVTKERSVAVLSRADTSVASPSKQLIKTSTTGLKAVAHEGNLSGESLGGTHADPFEEGGNILPKEKVALKYKGLRVGEVLEAEITEEVTVYPEGKIPVRAIVRGGGLRGAILIGEATLERNSKKMSVTFTRLIPERGEGDYQINGYALVEGEHHTNEKKFFLAEFLSAGAAGFADASIERNQNVYGNYVDTPGIDTTSKKALGAALSKTTERFAEKSRSAPEYVVVAPSTLLQILLTE